MLRHFSSWFWLFLCTLSFFGGGSARSQVTSDGTVNTQVTQNGNVAAIAGGEVRGSNLFHSFQDFSVPNGNEAFFNNGTSISNIFSRVTGGNISDIDGAIRANGTASLFLVNPAGIVFGENARLDIGGSFYGSTASSILFEDGEFSTVDNLQQPVLTVNAPIGLGFRDNPGSITNRSLTDDFGLQVIAGQKINLLGGNLSLTGGKITAPGGVINLGGLSTAEIITIESDGNISLPDNVAKANVFLTENAVVDISAEGGGSITVHANNLELIEGSSFLAGIEKGSGSENAVAGTIQIDATRIFANDDSQIHSNNFGIGQAGTVNINTNTLDFEDNSAIVVSTFGQGNAGTVNITAQDISFEQEWGGIYGTVGLSRVATEDPVADTVGNGGEINIDTDTLALADGARISVNSVVQGDAGNINIKAPGKLSFGGVGDTPVPAFGGGMVISGLSSQVQFEGVGNSGQVTIEAGSLNLDTGAVFVDNSGIEGDAGNITLDIQNNISLDQGALIDAQVTENSKGDAGVINIIANSFESNGSSVLADNQGLGNSGTINFDIEETISLNQESIIQTELGEKGIGNAGKITINTNSLDLNSSSNIVAQTEGQGDAGEILIAAKEAISLNQSQISSLVNSSATGNGANIFLTAGELNLNAESLIIANTNSQGANPSDVTIAGNINLDIAGNINLDNNSKIQSQVGENTLGNAGIVTINTDGSLISNGSSQILTNSEGNGAGGDIQIIARESIELRDGSLIFASASGQSTVNAGIVTLEAGNTFSLSESLVLSQIQGEAEGNAGDIDITGNTVDINNFSLVSSNAGGGTKGAAGNINLNGTNISINSGSVVDALTENNSDGGNITISGGNLEIASGGVVVTSTTSDGKAGSIVLNDLTGNITINGEGTIPRPEDVFPLTEQVLNELQKSTGLFATSSATSTGDAGNINVRNIGDLSISNSGEISVDSEGKGNGGILTINADSLYLNNQAAISAVTESDNGGNINLAVDDKITLENNSTISTKASANGNGGNIKIDTNFIVAFPNQNNDIVANAQAGQGGNIGIAAESVLGITERDSDPPNDSNDIDASSEFGLNGNVSIFAPDTNTLQGAVELPSNTVVPQETAQQVCESNRVVAAQGSFAVKGKGGVPDAPDLPLSSQILYSENENIVSEYTPEIETSIGKIQPARGMVKDKVGRVKLTAYSTDNSGERIPVNSSTCGQA